MGPRPTAQVCTYRSSSHGNHARTLLCDSQWLAWLAVAAREIWQALTERRRARWLARCAGLMSGTGVTEQLVRDVVTHAVGVFKRQPWMRLNERQLLRCVALAGPPAPVNSSRVNARRNSVPWRRSACTEFSRTGPIHGLSGWACWASGTLRSWVSPSSSVATTRSSVWLRVRRAWCSTRWT